MRRFVLFAVACIVIVTAAANAEVVSTLDVGPDAAPGTAEALYDVRTGELFFDVGEGIVVIGISSDVVFPDNVDHDSIFGTPQAVAPTALAYFNPSGLPVGEDSIGLVLPAGLEQDDMLFVYAAVDMPNVYPPVTMIVSDTSTDFNGDGNVDVVDVNLLTAVGDLAVGVAVPPADAKFDLIHDDIVDSADLDQWLVDAAMINGLGSPYLRGDANLDGDVDVWDFDGSGDAQVLMSNMGMQHGAKWGDGDFNGDGDVDVWWFDNSGDAQVLMSNMGAIITDVGPDAAAGTAEALYDPATGELSFDVGSGVAVVGIGSAVMYPGAVDATSIFGAPIQSTNTTLAYFDTGGLPVGEDSVGLVLPPGLTQEQLTFSYTPTSGPTQKVDVTIVPEPSTFAMLGVLLAIALCWRRRRA